LITPHKGGNLSSEQTDFNKEMSQVRLAVEWGFGKVLSIFAFLDFKKNQKILLSPIGKYYTVGVLLTNCHTCINGSIASWYFDCIPPSLEDYLS
jgi:nuclease HARBI1